MAKYPSCRGLEWNGGRLVQFLAPLLAALMLFLTGCGEGSCNCFPMNPPVVRVAHVRPLHGLDTILLTAAENDYGGDFDRSGTILGLASYTADDGAQHLLASLDSHVYTLALSGVRATVVPDVTCGRGATFSLTADGSRLACLGSPEPQMGSVYGCTSVCVSKQVQIVAYSPNNQHPLRMPQTISDTGNNFSSPTWRPDGTVLAMLESVAPDAPYNPKDTSPVCKLALYAQQPPRNPMLVPALSLTVARFSLCDALQLAWSPDGRTLAILTRRALLFVTPPAPDVIARAASTGHFVRAILSTMRKVTLGNLARAMAWAPDSRSVAVVSHDAGMSKDEVVQYSAAASTLPTPLFTLPTIIPGARTTYALVGPITYSADGHMVIFAYGMRQVQLISNQLAGSAESAPYPPVSCYARVPLVALRPQTCLCPYPPTGLYAYMLPTTTP